MFFKSFRGLAKQESADIYNKEEVPKRYRKHEKAFILKKEYKKRKKI